MDNINLPPFTLYLGDEENFKIWDEQELEQILVGIKQNHDFTNRFWFLNHPNGNQIALGIAKEGCYLNFVPASLNPPYYSTLGDRTLSGDNGTVEIFSSDGSCSEIKRRNLVSFEEGLKIVKEFFRSGERSDMIGTWEMD